MEKLTMPYAGVSVSVYDARTLGEMKASTLNAMEGELTGYDCPQCRNKGITAHCRPDGSLFTRECDCMNIRRCLWEMERSGLAKTVEQTTFDSFEVTESWQKALKSGAMAYADQPEGWLLLAGQSGCGKTHLCTAVCRKLLHEGYQVRYMPWREKVAQLKSVSLEGEQRDRLLQSWKEAQILYIDDLFKTGRNERGGYTTTAADMNLAFEILNHRYLNGLRTIISTERMPVELVDLDEAVGSRILEMAGSHVYTVERQEQRNYRLRFIKKRNGH